MKNAFLIIGIFLTSSLTSYAVQKVYLQDPNSWGTNILKRTIFNPYSYQYRSPYTYYKVNKNDAKRIQRLNRIRHLNRIKNNLTWNFNKNNKGSLTGYSTPINEDVYKQMGIYPYNSKQKSNSINCNTDLFSSPSGNEMYYDNGRFYKNLGGVSGKTGVTIIYD